MMTNTNDRKHRSILQRIAHRDQHAAAYDFWYEMHKGIHEMLREYPV